MGTSPRGGLAARLAPWALAVAVWAGVSALVLLPASGQGGGLPIPDKLAHAAAWCALALSAWPLAARALPGTRVRRAVIVVASAALWGVATELLQAGVPGRAPDALDALADLVGAGVGAALAWAASRQR